MLVDGIERDLDLVDTDDIASFSILKDASASAVYGVRGANGVILITTKKGEDGRNFTMKLLQPSIIRTKPYRNTGNIVTPISTRM